jgi:hypothetical protein
MNEFNQSISIPLAGPGRKKEVIVLSKAPPSGYTIWGGYMNVGYFVDVGDTIMSLDTIPRSYTFITLKSHCKGVVIYVKNEGDIVKSGDTLVEIEVGLDLEYIEGICNDLFVESFKSRFSITCQHDDFDDFDIVSIKVLNSSSELTLHDTSESHSYLPRNVYISLTFIGGKFYMNLTSKGITQNNLYQIMAENEAVFIFENNIRERYKMNYRKHDGYSSAFWICELSYNDMCVFATKSLVKAKIASVPVLFTAKGDRVYQTIKQGQWALKFMAASILKYVSEKYPDKFGRTLVQKAKTIHEMYQTKNK